MVKKEYKEQLIVLIKKYQPICKIYLYGSRARGDYSQGSDIDLALDAGRKIEPKTISLIKEAIEESTIPLFVDIIDLNAVTPEFKNKIIKDVVIWIT